jgi:hypothetical protein
MIPRRGTSYHTIAFAAVRYHGKVLQVIADMQAADQDATQRDVVVYVGARILSHRQGN